MTCFRSDHVIFMLLSLHLHMYKDKRLQGVMGKFIVPGLQHKRFVKLGDINIGVMVPLSRYDRNNRCSDEVSMTGVHLSQVIEYAVDRVNEGNQLPGNVTLGIVVLDDCYNIDVAVAQSLRFLPQTSCPKEDVPYTSISSGVIDPYDVVAVIGASLSSQSVPVAHVLGPALVPQISFFSTSDDLSNDKQFPYFARTTPPDRFQFQAIFSVIRELDWTFVSVIYMEGSYGENGFKQLRDLFDAKGICFAAVHKVITRITDEQAKTIAKDLVEYKNARGVVIITTFTNAFKVIKAASDLVPAGTFTWIGSDAWSTDITQFKILGDTLLDAFTISTYTALVPHYEDYFGNLSLEDTNNPWFVEFYENLFQCTVENGTCPSNVTVRQSGVPFYKSPYVGHAFDTLNVLANATSRVLRSASCRDLKGPRAARACLAGPALLAEVKATRQNGVTGWMELDAQGDRMGRYVIKQVVAHPHLGYEAVKIAEFDSLTGTLNLVGNVSWARGHHDAARSGRPHPESTCSQPCGAHQARVVQEVTCCWLCQPCRLNERLMGDREGGSRCQACPPFSWPDPLTANTSCAPIPRDAPRLDSVQGCVQTAVALLSLAACLLVCLFFHRHRHCRVIKASSRELSFLMLLAIATGYVTMVTLLAPPGDLTCRLNFVLFCVSFTLIYGPLLVRALRIFRIFEASTRSARTPRWIDSSHQLIFSFMFLAVQVGMCVVVLTIHPQWHRLTQRSPQDRYVELSCHFPLWGLTSFLAYNLALVAVCTLLAFKTRRLPDNFNESRFISMCVSTKLLILLCFIPAYLVSGRELLRMLMLALAVALNHSVALVFLFLPKIYAVLYIEGADSNQPPTAGSGGSGGGGGGRVGVGPASRLFCSTSSRVSDSTRVVSVADNGGLASNYVVASRPVVLQVRPATISGWDA